MIGTVKHSGSTVEIFDENGSYKATIQYVDGLVGYTSTTVTVKKGYSTELYDEDGNYISSL